MSNNIINLGDKIDITGIVSQTKTGYRLLPKDKSDIIIKEKNQQINMTEEKNTINPKYKYIAILFVGVLSMLLIKFLKKKKNIKKD